LRGFARLIWNERTSYGKYDVEITWTAYGEGLRALTSGLGEARGL
jgi:hypothetical protein